jgi:hypothetical protein
VTVRFCDLADSTPLAAQLGGSIVISGTTEGLVRGLLELRDLGLQHVKGVAEPVHCHAVLAEHRELSRLRPGRAPVRVSGWRIEEREPCISG